MGNWRATLNAVITQYVALKYLHPEYSDKEIFMLALDARYQKPKKDLTGLLVRMYERKNQIKQEIKHEIDEGMSIIDKYSLPILIYTCLVIEQNNYLSKNVSVEELLEPITNEVKRQGFEKYC